MQRSKKLTLAAGVCAVLVAANAPWAGADLQVAQDIVRARPRTTVEGIVSTVDGPIVRILGGLVSIDVSEAHIVGEGKPISESDSVRISAGDRITAQVEVPDAPPRPLLARTVVVFPQRDGSIEGAVQSVNLGARSFRVANEDVRVTSTTKFRGSNSSGPVTSLEDLEADDHVAASLTLAGQTLVAELVEVFPPPVELVSFTGTVQAITPAIWTISGRAITVTPETKIVDDPQVGDTVQVLAKLGDGDRLIALSIVKITARPTFTPGPPPPTRTEPVRTPKPTSTPGPTRTPGPTIVEFRGTVEKIPEGRIGTWIISAKPVIVTADTVVDGSPTVGDAVVVSGVIPDDPLALTRGILARKIAKITR